MGLFFLALHRDLFSVGSLIWNTCFPRDCLWFAQYVLLLFLCFQGRKKNGNPVTQWASIYQFSVALLIGAGYSRLINYIYLNWTQNVCVFRRRLESTKFFISRARLLFFSQYPTWRPIWHQRTNANFASKVCLDVQLNVFLISQC